MALRFDELPAQAVRISKQLMRAPDRELIRKVIEEEGALFGQRLRSPASNRGLQGAAFRPQLSGRCATHCPGAHPAP